MAKLREVIRLLTKGSPLPPRYRDDSLGGDWKSYRDCHIETDWLLISIRSTLTTYIWFVPAHTRIFSKRCLFERLLFTRFKKGCGFVISLTRSSERQCYDNGLCPPPIPCLYVPASGFRLRPLRFGLCVRPAGTCRNTATSASTIPWSKSARSPNSRPR